MPALPTHHAPTRRLAAFTPVGMTDWPGRVAATLSLSGCSLACPYCDARDLPTTPDVLGDWDRIVSEILARADMLDGVVVTGGEPTDDPDLPSLLAALAEVEVPVCLQTNGTRPDVLRLLVAEQLVSTIALDVKTVPDRYAMLSARAGTAALVAESVEIVIRSGLEHEFRTTMDPRVVSLAELPRIARALRGGMLLVLQQCRPRPASDGSGVSWRQYALDELRSAATACSTHLPTVVRPSRPRAAS